MREAFGLRLPRSGGYRVGCFGNLFVCKGGSENRGIRVEMDLFRTWGSVQGVV